jgi:hypothetical protein
MPQSLRHQPEADEGEKLINKWKIINRSLSYIPHTTEALRSVLPTKYYSGNQLEKMRWAGHEARIGDRRGTYRVLAGKPERKILLGRPRHRRYYSKGYSRNGMEAWAGFIWLGFGTGSGFF